jgi:hypothetical protein
MYQMFVIKFLKNTIKFSVASRFPKLPPTDGAMSSWGLRGREPINRAESLQAKATHAQPLKPQLLMSPCCGTFIFSIHYNPKLHYV